MVIWLYIPPCCDDTGQSLGAISHLILELFGTRPFLELPYVGIGSSFTYSEEILNELVEYLLSDEIIILHNAKAEIGPRALGNRSFIARPDSIKVKKILSQQIKCREDYRPLAPVVLKEMIQEYFIESKESPFMLYQYRIKPDVKNLLRGAIHHDNTARVQTLDKNKNKFLYDLIKRFGERTGAYALINTSLNLKGESISNTLEDTLNISDRITYSHRIVYNGSIIE